MEIKVTIKRNAADINAAYALIRDPNAVTVIYNFKLYILLAAAAFFVYVDIRFYHSIFQFRIAELVMFNLMAFGSLIFTYFKKPKRGNVGEMLIKQHPKFGMQEDITINDDGFVNITTNGRVMAKWTAYKSAIITADTIVLSGITGSYSFFPKRFFSDEDYNAFSALVEGKIEQTKKM